MPHVRVMSYNVHGLRDDRAALCEVVRAHRPDVLVVQESPRHLRWRPRCAALARECGLLYVAGGRTAGGNLLLASARMRVHGVVECRIPQRLGAPMRGVVAATLGIGDVRLGVVGMHLGLAAAGRRRDVAEVLRAVRACGELPVVVAGDVNEPAGGPSWQAFAAAGFRDVGADSDAATFPAVRPRQRIDAVLVSRAEATGEVPRVGDSALAHASDHLPVLATVTIG